MPRESRDPLPCTPRPTASPRRNLISAVDAGLAQAQSRQRMEENASPRPSEAQAAFTLEPGTRPRTGNVFIKHKAWWFVLVVWLAAAFPLALTSDANPASPNLATSPTAIFGSAKRSWNARERDEALSLPSLSTNDLAAAAQAGDPKAQVILGFYYEMGHPFPVTDRAKALELYRKAAASEYPKAYYRLAMLLSHENKADAEKQLRKAAELGYADAQFELGRQLAQPGASAGDLKEAIIWLNKAADQIELGALLLLGEMYETGRGVPQDRAKAAIYYDTAASVADDTFDYISMFSQARKARFCLDMLRDQGWGIPRTRQEAISLYRNAAEQGNATAQYFLAQIYAFGYDSSAFRPESKADYHKWIRKAAEGGQGEAQYLLGADLRLHPETKTESREWLSKAVAQHVAEAYKPLLSSMPEGRKLVEIGLAKLPMSNTPSELNAGLFAYSLEDWTNAHRFFQAAAGTDDANSQYALGVMYSLGRGVPTNESMAKEWFYKAARPPSSAALTELSLRRVRGETNELIIAMALSDLRIAAEMGNQEAKEAFLKTESLFPGAYYLWTADKTPYDPKAPNPLLRGIKGICVASPILDSETSKLLSFESLQTTAELRLRSAGIKLLDNGLPVLRIRCECVKVADGPIYAVQVRIELSDVVEYHLQQTVAPTWDAHILSWAGESKVLSHTKGVIEEIVDRFANEFLKANPKD